MRLILLGAPGAGKGTIAEIIRARLNIPTISTGNILREAILNRTKLGRVAKPYIDAGKLVPDNVIIELIKNRLSEADCKNGFMLDGVPRTAAQAAALDEIGLNIDAVLMVEASDEVIERRLSGRRVCKCCGATYHLKNKPPRKENQCDSCGGALVRRADDTPEIIRDRLKVYHDKTKPLIEYYSNKDILLTVDGQKNIEETKDHVFSVLGIMERL